MIVKFFILGYEQINGIIILAYETAAEGHCGAAIELVRYQFGKAEKGSRCDCAGVQEKIEELKGIRFDLKSIY